MAFKIKKLNPMEQKVLFNLNRAGIVGGGMGLDSLSFALPLALPPPFNIIAFLPMPIIAGAGLFGAGHIADYMGEMKKKGFKYYKIDGKIVFARNEIEATQIYQKWQKRKYSQIP